ncbi:MAG: PAS domain-containing protein [Coleofasciculaceae cyanobacterium]
MSSKVVAFRLPEELMQAVVSQAKATGKSKTAVVVDALKKVFGFPVKEDSNASLEGVQNQLDTLREKVSLLNQQILELEPEVSLGSNELAPGKNSLTLGPSQEEVEADILPVRQSEQLGGLIELTDLNSEELSKELEPIEDRSSERGEDLEQLAAKLEQRARMLDQVLSACVDHVCMYDRLGRYTYANPALMQSLGLEGTELYGKTWQQLGLPEETRKLFEVKLQHAFATGQSIAEEISLPTVNGVREYEYILNPIPGEDGTVEAVVYTGRDITERKRAEELLQESEKNYRNLFEWAHDSIFITDHSTRRLLDVNEHGARRLGYTRKQLLALPSEGISPPMDPEHRKAVLRQLWQTGSVVFEHVHRSKNGTIRPIEVSSRVIEYGGELAIQSFIRDITDRKQAETKLAETEHFIKQLAQIAPYLIYVKDLTKQQYTYSNNKVKDFYGLPAEKIEKMGRNYFKKYLHPDDCNEFFSTQQKLAQAKDDEVIEREFRIRHTNGQWRWFHSREVVLTRNCEGLPEKMIGTAIDVSERFAD